MFSCEKLRPPCSAPGDGDETSCVTAAANRVNRVNSKMVSWTFWSRLFHGVSHWALGRPGAGSLALRAPPCWLVGFRGLTEEGDLSELLWTFTFNYRSVYSPSALRFIGRTLTKRGRTDDLPRNPGLCSTGTDFFRVPVDALRPFQVFAVTPSAGRFETLQVTSNLCGDVSQKYTEGFVSDLTPTRIWNFG